MVGRSIDRSAFPQCTHVIVQVITCMRALVNTLLLNGLFSSMQAKR
jgi:hypothetical protein